MRKSASSRTCAFSAPVTKYLRTSGGVCTGVRRRCKCSSRSCQTRDSTAREVESEDVTEDLMDVYIVYPADGYSILLYPDRLAHGSLRHTYPFYYYPFSPPRVYSAATPQITGLFVLALLPPSPSPLPPFFGLYDILARRRRRSGSGRL